MMIFEPETIYINVPLIKVLGSFTTFELSKVQFSIVNRLMPFKSKNAVEVLAVFPLNAQLVIVIKELLYKHSKAVPPFDDGE